MKSYISIIIFIFTALQNTQVVAAQNNSNQLASFDNPVGYDAPEGSSAKLTRENNICTIKIIQYGETGKAILTWSFDQFTLYTATEKITGYTDGGLTMLSLNQGKFSEYPKSSQRLDIHLAATQKDFQRVRGFFPTQLAQCLAR
ncbi:hypothetical protein [Acinetobacter sp. MD2(2019)]|uniref:hypothetical protein n=1 Tax=Acinetobacter sp. MD2(2019) TaxID=2605273 RepID=UPI002D1E682E|nr:hypothetical protein [Acinetobacter sp. MD2(2019)]MEB3753097.1 hypothetical protein [Acinetobacter sp. MD2(2019)]